MSGTKIGGMKARLTNYQKYGLDFYRNIGKKGGKAECSKPKGFAANPELAREAGAKGGRVSKRGKAKK
jgi:general stress protein YciG